MCGERQEVQPLEQIHVLADVPTGPVYGHREEPLFVDRWQDQPKGPPGLRPDEAVGDVGPEP